MRHALFISLLACGSALAADAPDFLASPAGAIYRVVNTDAVKGAAPFTIKPTEAGDVLPARQVRIETDKAITFGDAINSILDGSGITASYVGELRLPQRTLDGLKVSGDLKAVLDTLAQSAGVQYLYRDNVLRFVTSRPYVLTYADATEQTYMTGLIRKNGGVVSAAPKGRNELIFTANYAAMRRIRADIEGFYSLKRDPSQQLSRRAVLVPEKVAAPSSALLPAVFVREGRATIHFRGEATDLVRQIAAAAGAVYGGTDGRPRDVRVEVDVTDKPLMVALEAIGNAMGTNADLQIRGRTYKIIYR